MRNRYWSRSIFSFIFAVFFVLSLVVFMPGCGEKKETPPVKTKTDAPKPAPEVKPPQAAKKDANIAHITDIHFNPFYDATLVQDLVKAKMEEWETVFLKSKIKELGTVGKDETNYPLLVSTLENMQKNINQPDFIVFTGDFLVHEFEKKFAKYAGSKAKIEPFIDKTVGFVSLMFKKYFPGIPVYISLGNNDCYSGDYQIIPGGKFLANTSTIFSETLLYSPDNRERFCKTYPEGGYFELVPAKSKNARVISLNTILFSPKHKNTLDYDPAERELEWLEKRLAEAMEKKRNVWLLLHIPPGTNIYSSIHKKTYTPMWKSEYNDRFIQLSRTYADIIMANFCGHTHMDNFRVLLDQPGSGKNHVYGFIRIGPAVSPQFGNNPGYQGLTYDRAAFTLGNDTLYFIGLSPVEAQPVWKKEYDYKGTYGHDAMTPLSMLSIYESLNTDETVRANYIKYFNVSNTAKPPITPETWKAYWCGIAQWTQAAFESCTK